uniref:Uncharacterized protein n=1 Tax=Arion vulgaris TaxID=1028688 RepID=A0A0B6ZHM9_9EUPU
MHLRSKIFSGFVHARMDPFVRSGSVYGPNFENILASQHLSAVVYCALGHSMTK